MRRFSKVVQVFVGTTEGSSPSSMKSLNPPPLLIQIVSDMAKMSVSLSEINFTMAGYLLCIDLTLT